MGHRRVSLLPSFAILAALVSSGCDSPTQPSEPLPITRVTQGIFSNFQTPQRLAIRSQDGLVAAWAQIFGGPLALPPPLPQVDFANEMIVLVASGSKPTSGFVIAVAAAAGTGDIASVTVRSLSPAAGCVTLPAVTEPYDMVRLPRRDEVRFIERSDVQSCY